MAATGALVRLLSWRRCWPNATVCWYRFIMTRQGSHLKQRQAPEVSCFQPRTLAVNPTHDLSCLVHASCLPAQRPPQPRRSLTIRRLHPRLLPGRRCTAAARPAAFVDRAAAGVEEPSAGHRVSAQQHLRRPCTHKRFLHPRKVQQIVSARIRHMHFECDLCKMLDACCCNKVVVIIDIQSTRWNSQRVPLHLHASPALEIESCSPCPPRCLILFPQGGRVSCRSMAG